jgi:ParG
MAKKFSIVLPDELHQRFKIHCVLENVSMRDVLRDLVEQKCKGVPLQAKPEKGRARAKSEAGAEAA